MRPSYRTGNCVSVALGPVGIPQKALKWSKYANACFTLDVASCKQWLAEFKLDPLRHVMELSGRTPPKEGDMKGLLPKGKVVMVCSSAIRQLSSQCRTNEADTNTAYERAVNFRGCGGGF
ncbi:MAG: hypothetical protein WA633_18260 [Stellaceae bacterium]